MPLQFKKSKKTIMQKKPEIQINSMNSELMKLIAFSSNVLACSFQRISGNYSILNHSYHHGSQ